MLTIESPGKIIRGKVDVPFSKSESNRTLLINALSGNKSVINNISDADDTKIMSQILASDAAVLNAYNAGTAARFAIAYCAVMQKEVMVTGDERMQQRPVKSLIDALTLLGAHIQYSSKPGFLPVKIYSSTLKSQTITIDASESSQHVSALMMIAPLLPSGLTINLAGAVNSAPYIYLTQKIMQHFGAAVSIEKNKIVIAATKYAHKEYTCGGDWSAAAFWFELAALCDEAEIEVCNLDYIGLQGDEVICNVMQSFGVTVSKTGNGMLIKKIKAVMPEYFSYDFSNCPDIALPVAAVCGAYSVQSDLYGLKNLVIKESDRVSAFQRESYKLNIKTDFCECSKLKIFNYSSIKPYSKSIKTYNDHRVAMTFAPLSVITGKVIIDNGLVVSKSFPAFWENMKRVGFLISS